MPNLEFTEELIVVVSLLICATITTVIGNCLILIAWFKYKSIQSPQNSYIVSLAFVDLLVGIIILPMDIIEEIEPFDNLTLCQCRHFIIVGLCTVSIFHLIAIAWDRYKMVVYGVTYIQRRTMASILQVIVGMWVIGFWISIPPLFDPEHWSTGFNCFYNNGMGWVMHNTLGSFIFPTILMIKLYSSLFATLQQRLRQRPPTISAVHQSEAFDEPSIRISGVSPVKLERLTLKRERRTLRMLGIIIGVYLMCWLPFFIVHVLKEFILLDMKIFKYLSYLGHANSGMNPLIYSIFNRDFKSSFIQILTFGRIKASNNFQ